MKQCFVETRFSTASQSQIETINSILDEYQSGGYDLSLRQLYYQLVARGYIENSQRSYKNVGNLVSNARLSGLIDWDMIKDRGRETVSNNHWESPAQIVNAAANQFQIDKWETQPYHIEVMVEKQALEGVLIPVCKELDIPFTANKGYSSSSTMYEVGKRLYRQLDYGKQIVILYAGDHDPSGLDMTRDVRDRLMLFSEADEDEIEVVRIALNYDQIQSLNPPENPAKDTDSRYEDYVRKFGYSSWELDAVEPRALADLVRQAVNRYLDLDLWDEAVDKETIMKNKLLSFAQNYKE